MYIHSRSWLTPLFVLFVLGAQGCATSQSTVEAAPGSDAVQLASSEQPEAEETLICKNIRPTGSRIGEKICASKERWEKAEQEAKDKTSEVHRRSVMQNPDGA